MANISGRFARLAVGAAIAIGLAIWLALDHRWIEVVQILGRVSPPVILGAALGLLITYLLRTFRVFEEFRGAPGVSFPGMLRVVMLHNLMVNIVPFRGGEAAFPVLLHGSFGISLARAAGSLLWFRLQDLFVVAALALAAASGLPMALRLAGLLVLAALAYELPRWARRPHEANHARGPIRVLQRLRSVFAEATERSLNGWWWTIANWIVKLAVQAWLLAQIMPGSIEVALAGVLGAETSAILPVQGLAGLGTYEAGAAAFMMPYGIPFERGLQGALALHLVVIGCALLGGALALLLPMPRENIGK
jgi:uncharacterized membrane protein YbhN (UPF0104 family)